LNTLCKLPLVGDSIKDMLDKQLKEQQKRVSQ
jgi:hypothetical protein